MKIAESVKAMKPQSKVYYAIGDIHGELDRLISLHESISDFHAIFYPKHTQIRIHLGDYVDRGPESCGVVDYLMDLERQAAFKVINLKGNHESLMIDAFSSKNSSAYNYWLQNGGDQTINSYVSKGLTSPPRRHLEWLKSLPTQFIDKTLGLVFVHAGIDPDNYPYGTDEVHMWTRSDRFFDSTNWINPELEHVRVIHGHTPTRDSEPYISNDQRRINIDTGAVYGGKLSAAIIIQEEGVKFLAA